MQIVGSSPSSSTRFEAEAAKGKKETERRPSAGEEKPVEKIPPVKSRDQAASQVGVNPRYVSDAKKIKAG